MTEEEKIKAKKHIDYWENEEKDYLKKGDTMSAMWCRILANNLRKEIGEQER